MTQTWLTGPALGEVWKLPDNSVDLVATSPPFLALRDYNGVEGQWGSESTPAAFLDNLLTLAVELRRVLTPHGSLAVELGDTFSGSGGAGGDYADEGWRAGQARFSGAAARARSRRSNWTQSWARWLAGIIDAEGYIGIRRQTVGRAGAPSFAAVMRVTMMDRQVVDKCAEVTGVGGITQDSRGAYSWSVSAQQARYVLLHIWPDLLIKQRQALAAIELQRRIEEVRCRGSYAELGRNEVQFREGIRDYVRALNGRGDDRGASSAIWDPPRPERIRLGHSEPTAWPLPKSLCGIPTLFAWSLAYGRNLLNPAHEFDPWLVRNVIVWARNNPPVGALGDKVRPATSYITVACPSPRRWFDLDAVRSPGSPHSHARTAKGVAVAPNETKSGAVGRGGGWSTLNEIHNTNSAPPLDHWHDEYDGDHTWLINTQGSSLAHYAMWPAKLAERLILAMCPREVCRDCGEPRRRLAITTNAVGHAVARRSHANGADPRDQRRDRPDINTAPDRAERLTLGWSDCGHNNYRPGLTLDPFSGTGTTVHAAEVHGRDGIGIDLDPINAGLRDRRRDEVRRNLLDVTPEVPGQLTLEALL